MQRLSELKGGGTSKNPSFFLNWYFAKCGGWALTVVASRTRRASITSGGSQMFNSMALDISGRNPSASPLVAKVVGAV
ncbi:hypothetical protein [Corynebacterium kutscheri]|uniref:hypothetical protein n=1 Tax=Corynebacterium kutscheri TaxID=35755 RepID=UPI000F82777F|nr:hypothetical protein [Corynebacterium kutscheri]